MTDTELRELDDWIAENVMGWRWFEIKGSDGLVTYAQTALDFAEQYAKHYSKKERLVTKLERAPVLTNHQKLTTHSFNPTTNMGHAMQVMQRCINHLGNTVIISGSESTGYVISGPNGAYEVEAETLPLSIALFAKKLFSKE